MRPAPTLCKLAPSVNTLIQLLLLYGVPIVFVATLLARIGAPLPAAPLLVVAGGLSAGAQLSAPAVLLASLVANVAGDAVWFIAGRRHGHRILRLLCRISLSQDSCVRQSESLILRWGGASLIAAKFVPGVSVVAAPMAGAMAMPWRTFLLFGLAAGGLWSLLFLGLGLVFHQQIQQVLEVMSGMGTAAVGVLVVAVLALVAWRFWRRRRAMQHLAMPRVSVDELRSLLSQGHEPVIVDVRTPQSVQLDERRIPGALHVPLEQVPALAEQLGAEREVIVYCDCPNEASAAVAAQLLLTRGIARVRPLTGGLDAWFAGSP
jgi:membrane protein DedA with SNARE-associated domain/rhodanese-related sulfurtransferase